MLFVVLKKSKKVSLIREAKKGEKVSNRQQSSQGQSQGQTTQKISHQEFVLRAIKALRVGQTNKNGKPVKGIHTVYSGFNGAFKKYYGEGSDPIATTKKLAENKVIALIPRRGGVMIYLPEDAPEAGKIDKALELITAG